MRWKLPSLRIGQEFERRRQSKLGSESDDHNEHSGLPAEHEVDEVSKFAVAVNVIMRMMDGQVLEGLHHNILVEDRLSMADDSTVPSAPSTAEDGEDLQSFGPGWRVEFRPLEVQLTDFENAAFANLVVLISRSILAGRMNLYMPMSLVEENMRRAQLKDAARTQRFWVRKGAFSSNQNFSLEIPRAAEVEVEELTLDEIFNGKACPNSSPSKPCCEEDRILPNSEASKSGVLPAVSDYLLSLGCGGCAATGSQQISGRDSVLDGLDPYLSLLSKRASGYQIT